MDKKLLSNLKAYLDPSINIPIYLYDTNSDKQLPAIILGVEKYEVHPVLDNNATVEGFVMVAYRGTQDPNKNADNTAKDIKSLLQNTALYTSMNKPLSGADTRPLSGFTLDRFDITGMEKKDEDHSTTIFINWQAFIADSDTE